MNCDRPQRSWLFTSATRADRFAKASAVGADVLIIDLEDSVAPAEKDKARKAALAFLASAQGDRVWRAVRINALGSRAGIDDVCALLGSAAALDALIVSKTESAAELRLLDCLLSEAGKTTSLIALIESARGVDALPQIARSAPRLSALMFGAADFAADLGADVAWEPLLYARSRVVSAAAITGLKAIDAPYFNLNNLAGLAAETKACIALGFNAKAAVHPGQVACINAALTPTPESIERARQILAENAKGVGLIGGRMVDEAMARHARRVLSAAQGLL